MSTHCTLNAVVDEVEGDADRAVVTSLLMNLGDDSPPSVVSLFFITQQLTRVDPAGRSNVARCDLEPKKHLHAEEMAHVLDMGRRRAANSDMKAIAPLQLAGRASRDCRRAGREATDGPFQICLQQVSVQPRSKSTSSVTLEIPT
jgi:hypothetical protein